jgi:integrase
MPRKPKVEKKAVVVKVNDVQLTVVLHPPAGARKSWYAYTAGWVASRSTGERDFGGAVKAVESMLRGDGGHRPELKDALLTDGEFEQIQRAHLERQTDPAARARAEKSLEEVLDAINAFRDVTGLSPVTRATADDCAAFQRRALALPRNWRSKHPRSKEPAASISPNTVLKWSRCLASAFERANRNAGRKKCVRGVVPESKLLSCNPWNDFTWIGGQERPVRQFGHDELLALLAYLQEEYADVPVAAAAAKALLWSACRKLELAGLTWDMLRVVGTERHFEIVGKWGVERWFRVPEPLFVELQRLREPASRFVFAAYMGQIRRRNAGNPGCREKIRGDFTAENFGRWLYNRVKEWAAKNGKSGVFLHLFRKTTLQHARRGEDVNRSVARDARLGEQVMLTSYVKETDEERRAGSNRTFARIVAGLPGEVARRYGHEEACPARLEDQLRAATEARDWGRRHWRSCWRDGTRPPRVDAGGTTERADVCEASARSVAAWATGPAPRLV